jgi:hypothetical protein
MYIGVKMRKQYLPNIDDEIYPFSYEYRNRSNSPWESKLLKTIESPIEAAKECANVSNYPYVREKLESSTNYKNWKMYSPWQSILQSDAPHLWKYINQWGNYTEERIDDFSDVIREGTEFAQILPVGQVLFHGGHLPVTLNVGKEFSTIAPLSTSLDPRIALSHGEHVFHKYRETHLWAMTINSPDIRCFVVRYGPSHWARHEKEVILLDSLIAKVKYIEDINTISKLIHISLEK